MTSIYGLGFDSLVERWTWVENEHDRMHPDRGMCGGVGQCPMMREACDLETQMNDQLENFRLKPKFEVQSAVKGSDLAAIKRDTLSAVLIVLGGWIEGAHSNHEALAHRGEPVGYECWRQFTPADIRNMVNDAAREVGVAEFPKPATPIEEMQ